MTRLRIDVVSLVPEAFSPLLGLGVIGRAFNAGIAELHIHNPRDHAEGRYRKVDDEPYGGGAGMVLKPEPVFAAFEAIPERAHRRVLLMSPQGTPLGQEDLRRWAVSVEQLVLLCGHYEGFDERIRSLADEEVSIGDFVLTGGELPAMVVINGVVRLLPGTVGTPGSLEEESHTLPLLEHPHYTRPASFRGMAVPEVLRSGDHGAIAPLARRTAPGTYPPTTAGSLCPLAGAGRRMNTVRVAARLGPAPSRTTWNCASAMATTCTVWCQADR